MSVNLQLRESAPELDGNPSLDYYLQTSAKSGTIGQHNAGRLLFNDIKDFVSDSTLQIISDIAGGSGPAQHTIDDLVLPPLRYASDFGSDERVVLRLPGEKTGNWLITDVWSSEYALSDNPVPSEQDRGLVIVQIGSMIRSAVDPRWPGLIPENIDKLFMSRQKKSKEAPDTVPKSKIVKAVFDFCFFSQLFEDHEDYRDCCYAGLRRYAVSVPKRPCN
jgi:hypothetical protein